jgi:hypothetical protein
MHLCNYRHCEISEHATIAVRATVTHNDTAIEERTGAEALEVGPVEHHAPALAGRRDAVLMRAMLEQRHLAEELALAEVDFALVSLDDHLTCGDDEHRIRGLAAARDHVALLERRGVEQGHDLRDRARIEAGEQGHARDERPRNGELAPRHLVAEARGPQVR